ncbi:hypothetical protein [Paludibacter sp.]|uniref:tetratricopeptide repeat protein n=1 Tax=Paludibacter sp. TaxID=1898105 RepID=UPI00135458A8|nr:hypothetical protein [Paludibacter sp.]MTK52060.1 hypothetical protein [Paludibacter sp.]
MEDQPASAIASLKKISHPQHLKQKDYALYALLMCQGMDKCGIDIKSDSLIKEAVNYYKNNNEFTRAGYSFFYLSRCERNKNDTQKQAEALLKAIPCAKKSDNHKLLGFVYSETASIYRSQNQIDSMIKFNKLAYYSLKQANDIRNCIVCLIGIGYGYYQKQNFQESLVYYKRAEKEAKNIKDNSLTSPLYKFTSLTLFYLHDYSAALAYARKSIETKQAEDPTNWFNLAAIFEAKNNLDSAKIYLSQCLKYKYNSPDCFELLQKISEREGNYQDAFRWAKLKNAAKDSINEDNLKLSLEGLEKKVNFEKIEADNQKLIIKNQRFTIIIALIAILCLIIVVIILIEQIKKNKLALKHETDIKIINRQKIKLQAERISKIKILQNLIQLKLIPKKNLSQIGAQYLKLFGEVDHSLSAHNNDIIKDIDSVFHNFSQKLTARFPTLTPKEILVCCYLKAGVKQESILSLLNIKSETYYHYRSNIRKKMNAGQDDKVEHILSDI